MATLSLWQRFEVTVGTVTYTGGSLTTAQSVTTSSQVVYKEVTIGTTAVKLFDKSVDLATTTAADKNFSVMWIENMTTTATANVQITVSAGSGDEFVARVLAAGERWTFITPNAWTGGAIDAVVATTATIDEVWSATSTGNVRMKLFAIS
jgi:hypothetical protein